MDQKTPQTAVKIIDQQKRSRKTSRLLIKAGFEILKEQGLNGLTMPELSQRAGVSVGTVYRRFGDKEGLLDALLEEFGSGFKNEIFEKLEQTLAADKDPLQALKIIIHSMVTTYKNNQILYRVFVLRDQVDPKKLYQSNQASHEGRELFIKLLSPAQAFIRHPDKLKALDFAYRLIYSSCTHRAVNGANLESPTYFDWEDLEEQLNLSVSLYLFGELNLD